MRYLRQMYTRYGYPDMFAAYNAGPGRLDAYLAGRKALSDETLSYLSAIAPASETAFGGRQKMPSKPPKSRVTDGIFISQTEPGSLFVTLSSPQF